MKKKYIVDGSVLLDLILWSSKGITLVKEELEEIEERELSRSEVQSMGLAIMANEVLELSGLEVNEENVLIAIERIIKEVVDSFLLFGRVYEGDDEIDLMQAPILTLS